MNASQRASMDSVHSTAEFQRGRGCCVAPAAASDAPRSRTSATDDGAANFLSRLLALWVARGAAQPSPARAGSSRPGGIRGGLTPGKPPTPKPRRLLPPPPAAASTAGGTSATTPSVEPDDQPQPPPAALSNVPPPASDAAQGDRPPTSSSSSSMGSGSSDSSSLSSDSSGLPPQAASFAGITRPSSEVAVPLLLPPAPRSAALPSPQPSGGAAGRDGGALPQPVALTEQQLQVLQRQQRLMSLLRSLDLSPADEQPEGSAAAPCNLSSTTPPASPPGAMAKAAAAAAVPALPPPSAASKLGAAVSAQQDGSGRAPPGSPRPASCGTASSLHSLSLWDRSFLPSSSFAPAATAALADTAAVADQHHGRRHQPASSSSKQAGAGWKQVQQAHSALLGSVTSKWCSRAGLDWTAAPSSSSAAQHRLQRCPPALPASGPPHHGLLGCVSDQQCASSDAGESVASLAFTDCFWPEGAPQSGVRGRQQPARDAGSGSAAPRAVDTVWPQAHTKALSVAALLRRQLQQQQPDITTRATSLQRTRSATARSTGGSTSSSWRHTSAYTNSLQLLWPVPENAAVVHTPDSPGGAAPTDTLAGGGAATTGAGATSHASPVRGQLLPATGAAAAVGDVVGLLLSAVSPRASAAAASAAATLLAQSQPWGSQGGSSPLPRPLSAPPTAGQLVTAAGGARAGVTHSHSSWDSPGSPFPQPPICCSPQQPQRGASASRAAATVAAFAAARASLMSLLTASTCSWSDWDEETEAAVAQALRASAAFAAAAGLAPTAGTAAAAGDAGAPDALRRDLTAPPGIEAAAAARALTHAQQQPAPLPDTRPPWPAVQLVLTNPLFEPAAGEGAAALREDGSSMASIPGVTLWRPGSGIGSSGRPRVSNGSSNRYSPAAASEDSSAADNEEPATGGYSSDVGRSAGQGCPLPAAVALGLLRHEPASSISAAGSKACSSVLLLASPGSFSDADQQLRSPDSSGSFLTPGTSATCYQSCRPSFSSASEGDGVWSSSIDAMPGISPAATPPWPAAAAAQAAGAAAGAGQPQGAQAAGVLQQLLGDVTALNRLLQSSISIDQNAIELLQRLLADPALSQLNSHLQALAQQPGTASLAEHVRPPASPAMAHQASSSTGQWLPSGGDSVLLASPPALSASRGGMMVPQAHAPGHLHAQLVNSHSGTHDATLPPTTSGGRHRKPCTAAADAAAALSAATQPPLSTAENSCNSLSSGAAVGSLLRHGGASVSAAAVATSSDEDEAVVLADDEVELASLSLRELRELLGRVAQVELSRLQRAQRQQLEDSSAGAGGGFEAVQLEPVDERASPLVPAGSRAGSDAGSVPRPRERPLLRPLPRHTPLARGALQWGY